MKKILWIDDDFYHIQRLFDLVKKQGYTIDYALDALEGYQKSQKWKDYQIIVVDIILPNRKPNQKLPPLVQQWKEERFPGVGLVKWIVNDLRPKIPVIILTVFDDAIDEFNLHELNIQEVIPKTSLGPVGLYERIKKYLD